MPTTVAIFESAQAFRRGLAAALTDAGHSIVDDPARAKAAIVTLRDPEDCAVLDRLAVSHVVVALLPDPTPAAHSHALSHGVAGIAEWAAEPGEIVGALSDALHGKVRLPMAIAHALAEEWPDAHTPLPEVTDDEREWLGRLSAGTTVSHLAEEAGYSERAMFRKLHDLYGRLGVTSRAEAIVAAERLGLVYASPLRRH